MVIYDVKESGTYVNHGYIRKNSTGEFLLHSADQPSVVQSGLEDHFRFDSTEPKCHG